jgi:hypothetical protein
MPFCFVVIFGIKLFSVLKSGVKYVLAFYLNTILSSHEYVFMNLQTSAF